MGLVKNVTNKLESKIKSGEIKESEMIARAISSIQITGLEQMVASGAGGTCCSAISDEIPSANL